MAMGRQASAAIEQPRFARSGAPIRSGPPAWAQIRIAAHRHNATTSRLDMWDACGTAFIDCYCALTDASILFLQVFGFKGVDG
jgi:hypothetical protein